MDFFYLPAQEIPTVLSSVLFNKCVLYTGLLRRVTHNSYSFGRKMKKWKGNPFKGKGDKKTALEPSVSELQIFTIFISSYKTWT